MSKLAAPFQLSRPTIRDYVTLLQGVFQIDLLPAWHSNRLKRVIKSPKLHVVDTGVACSLLGLDAAGVREDRETYGRLVETFVFQELRRQADWSEAVTTFHHFRDSERAEVDIVLERDGRAVAGVEVKSSATVRSSDFRGLRKLQAAAGEHFTTGVVLYDGDTSHGFGNGLYAVPIRALWETA